MKRYYLIVFCLLCSNSLIAQEKETSLRQLEQNLKLASHDTSKINALYEIGEYWFEKGEMNTCQSYLEKGLAILSKDSSSVKNQKKGINFLSRLGGVQREKGNYENSLHHYQYAQKKAYLLKDTLLAGELHHNIGNVFSYRGDYKKAIQYFKEAIALKKKYTAGISLGISYGVLGSHYRKVNELDSALMSYKKAKSIYRSEKDRSLEIQMGSNMAVLYNHQKKYDTAISLLTQSISYHKKQGRIRSLSNAYYNIGGVYKRKKQYSRALKYMDSSLVIAKNEDFKRRMMYVYREKGSLYYRSKEYKKAYKASKMYKRYSDSLFNNEKSQRIAEMEYQHKLETQKIRNDVLLEEERKRVQLKAKAAKRETMIYLGLLLFILVAATIVYRLLQKNSRQKLQLASSELEKEKLEKKHKEAELKVRENDLQKMALENKIRHQTQKQVIDQVRYLITLSDEKERIFELKSLSASLLSSNAEKRADTQDYLDKVQMEFKINLDNNFSNFSSKEKELLCLMKLGLTNAEIATIFNNSLASIKSARYRVRKKLGVTSDIDLITYIETFGKEIKRS